MFLGLWLSGFEDPSARAPPNACGGNNRNSDCAPGRIGSRQILHGTVVSRSLFTKANQTAVAIRVVFQGFALRAIGCKPNIQTAERRFSILGHMKQPRKKPADLATRIAAITAVLVAVGALMAAAKPIYEALAPISCKFVQASWCETVPVVTRDMAVGTTGWIYVGTRVNDTWQVTAEEGREPPLTLQTANLPVPGQVYNLVGSIHLRADLPVPQPDGSRPTMTDSKGTMNAGSTVKVDSVKSIELKNPTRTWIWAHVTFLNPGSE